MEIESGRDQKNQEILINQHWEIVRLKSQGKSGTEVAQIVSCSPSQANAIYKKYLETHDVIGRPLKATPEVQKIIIEEVKTDPSLNVGQIIEESKADISETVLRLINISA